MDISHPDMVKKLAKPGVEIMQSLSAEAAHALHMAVGISGEVAELMSAVLASDFENALEELGDIEFYLQGICQGLDVILVRQDHPKQDKADDSLLDLVVSAGEVLDIAKKIAIYSDRTKWPVLSQAVRTFKVNLDKFYAVTDFTHADALEANIKKLGKRYEGFNYSDSAAKARADKQA